MRWVFSFDNFSIRVWEIELDKYFILHAVLRAQEYFELCTNRVMQQEHLEVQLGKIF